MHIHTSCQPRVNLGFNGYSCNWGVHMCGLYETDEERDGIMLGFLCEGAAAGDLQLYSLSEQSREDFASKVRLTYPACSEPLENEGVFQFAPARELYYPDGTFSPRAMDESLNTFFTDSQRNGPRNIRATAEMAWAIEAIPGRELLMVYESRLNYFIPGKPWISICMYNLNKFDGATILGVLRTHPYTINKGIVTENPFYIPPEIWLKQNAPDFHEPAEPVRS